MVNDPSKWRVNLTFYDLSREKADEIVDAAAKINDGVSVSMETIEAQFQSSTEQDRPWCGDANNRCWRVERHPHGSGCYPSCIVCHGVDV